MKIDKAIFGYYEKSDQAIPTYRPPFSIPCPVCKEPCDNGDPLKTVSFMAPGVPRSWFYHIHKNCATEENQTEIESVLVDFPHQKEEENYFATHDVRIHVEEHVLNDVQKMNDIFEGSGI